MSKCWNGSFISLNFNYDVVHYISTQKQVINYFSVLRHVCRLDTVFCPQYLSFQKWPESQRDRQEKFNSKNRGMTFLTVDVRYLGLLWPINLLFYKWAQQLCFFFQKILPVLKIIKRIHIYLACGNWIGDKWQVKILYEI